MGQASAWLNNDRHVPCRAGARRLERSIPAIRFSHDEWMTRLYGDDPPVERSYLWETTVDRQAIEIAWTSGSRQGGTWLRRKLTLLGPVTPP